MSKTRSKTRAAIDAFTAGKKAWSEQVPENSCPYDPRIPEAAKWLAGWKAARADSLLHEDR